MNRILETGMLLCFGFAWPVNIYKSVKAATAAGKSVVFLYVIVIGYLCGIANKILYSPDYVMWLYALNMLMVSIDIALYYRNRRLDAHRNFGKVTPAEK